MKVKHKEKGYIGDADKLNPYFSVPNEMIVYYEDGSASSEYVSDFEPVDPNDNLLEYLKSREL